MIDESPKIEVGLVMEEENTKYTPPFYITLSLHGKLIHNSMLCSGASHNLIPKVVMETLRVEVTKTYHDLYNFDSKPMKSVGMIKDLVVNLSHLTSKRILLDVVVTDVPPKYGMLLSMISAKRMGGTMQMDMKYATLPFCARETRRLYSKDRYAYVLSEGSNPTNYPIYTIEEDMGCCMLT